MQTIIPTKIVGPIKIVGEEIDTEVSVPLATYETPLFPSVNRGAKISRLCGGINVVIISECMTRSILLEAPNAVTAARIAEQLKSHHKTKLAAITAETSDFCKLQDWHTKIIGNLLYVRFSFTTADAAGHNMTTKAADALGCWIAKQYPELKYLSVSGNYCTDKKVSAVNNILGRGKYVVAEIVIPKELCQKHLHTSPKAIAELNQKKNLLGSIAAGSLCSANAHFANILLAIYLATGQDAANIIEGSQGITHAEMNENGDLYFSVTLPNIIVGTVGAGKDLQHVKYNLELLGCDDEHRRKTPGANSRRLAMITAATVLCGELSLLAALTRTGELVKCHIKLERGQCCNSAILRSKR
jgi:hydroxymethylglutaryl-CoA reductase (NADPH)